MSESLGYVRTLVREEWSKMPGVSGLELWERMEFCACALLFPPPQPDEGRMATQAQQGGCICVYMCKYVWIACVRMYLRS